MQTARKYPPSIALVGSSGGGTATLGHTQPIDLLSVIHDELSKIRTTDSIDNTQQDKPVFAAGLKFALFVSLHDGGFDSATDSSIATLYSVGVHKRSNGTYFYRGNDNDEKDENDHSFRVDVLASRKPLLEINKLYQTIDKILSNAIDTNQIQGLVSISSDPTSTNRLSMASAAHASIPVVGSGGTSLSAASAIVGLRLVGNSGGSVSTSTYTRAVGFAHALAVDLGGSYQFHSPSGTAAPKLGSILDACLPAFLGVVVSIHILKTMEDSASTFATLQLLVDSLGSYVLPTLTAVIVTRAYSHQHSDIAIMSSILASSSSCATGSVISGVAAGYLTSIGVQYMLYTCMRYSIPATMTNVILGGGLGSLTSIILHLLQLPTLLAWVTATLRSVLVAGTNFPGAGFLIGIVFCYGSKVGWYHALFLPLILMEMEIGGASVLGAVDECTLVMVSAGICAGNLSLPHTKEASRDFSKRGLCINLSCGDFIEAAYPSMERSNIINTFGYIASGFSTELLYCDYARNGQPRAPVTSSAYLPLPMSIWLSGDQWKRTALACAMAFGISYLGCLLGNSVTRLSSGTGTNIPELTDKKNKGD